uniref:Uncharacterized protein n=1 Tax=Rhizophora mucronata TaxID=61149 RepID=A0A2P2NT25_RHIMU
MKCSWYPPKRNFETQSSTIFTSML